MGRDSRDDLTLLLNLAGAGDADAQSRIWSSVYGEVRGMARGVRAGHALSQLHGAPSATTIIHEAFIKAFGGQRIQSWDNRAHFFGSLARAMAQFLVDWRRTSRRLKRGGGRTPASLEAFDAIVPSFEPIESFGQAIDEISPQLVASLDALQGSAPDVAEVIWLRYVAGLTLEETAAVLGVADRTVSKRWNYGRAWLRRDLDRRLGGRDGLAQGVLA